MARPFPMRDDKGPISQPRILSHGRNIEEEDGLAYTREIEGAVEETGGNIGDCGRRDHVFLSFVPEVHLHLGVKISRVGGVRRRKHIYWAKLWRWGFSPKTLE